jgi:hypothetical protein
MSVWIFQRSIVDALIISIAAGISLETLQKHLPGFVVYSLISKASELDSMEYVYLFRDIALDPI